MWSGVIVMIRTITVWLTTSAMIAANTPGRRMIDHTRSVVVSPGTASATASSSASSYGSGRRKMNDRIAARPTNTTGTRYGPASGGSPAWMAISPAIGTSVGPTTEPTVDAHTTVPIAEARRSVLTMSAAV